MKLFTILPLLLLASCANTETSSSFSSTLGSFFSSSITKTAVQIALDAGEAVLFAKTGQNFSPEAEAALEAMVKPLASSATDTALDAIAGALQATPTVSKADSGQLIAKITSTSAADVPTAVSVAETVPKIINTSDKSVSIITPATANLVVQTILTKLAATK